MARDFLDGPAYRGTRSPVLDARRQHTCEPSLVSLCGLFSGVFSTALWLVITEGTRPALLGMALGLVATFPLARVLRSLLFRVAPADPVTFFAVPILFACIALAACAIPARRAIRLDPARALLSNH